MRKFAVVAALLIVLPACESLFGNDDVFLHPASYLGKQVHICGFIQDTPENQTIWPSERDYARRNWGSELGFRPPRLVPATGPLNGTTACVDGTIVKAGCGTSSICNTSIANYALVQITSD